jgi:hypothetical protein
MIRVKDSELGITLASFLIQLVCLHGVPQFLVIANVVPSSLILSSWWWRRYIPPKFRFLQEPHGVTSQKTAFFKNVLVIFADSDCVWGGGRHVFLYYIGGHSINEFENPCLHVVDLYKHPKTFHVGLGAVCRLCMERFRFVFVLRNREGFCLKWGISVARQMLIVKWC